jgi:predicted nucleotide-binding protein
MPDTIRIFLGSAGETRRITDEIAAYLRKEEGLEVHAWTDPSAFPPGRTYIESLEANIRKCNCALLVATALDKTQTRGETQLKPRDNIVLEYGME